MLHQNFSKNSLIFTLGMVNLQGTDVVDSPDWKDAPLLNSRYEQPTRKSIDKHDIVPILTKGIAKVDGWST